MKNEADFRGGVPHRPAEKVRLDALLVERGLAQSREQAHRLILAGRVVSPHLSHPKPGMKVSRTVELAVVGEEKYVSRGGWKLEAALRAFGLTVTGEVCADIGASTGGFTDCLLQHGARLVYAVDVGRSTLHPKLRADTRVRLLEHTNARYLSPGSFDPAPRFVAIDVSFISVLKIMPAVGDSVCRDAQGVVLLKPQFEAGRREVSRGRGLVSDPTVHRRVLKEFVETLPETGWVALGAVPSPILGGSGNREYLVHVRRAERDSLPSGEVIDVDALVRAAFLIPNARVR